MKWYLVSRILVPRGKLNLIFEPLQETIDPHSLDDELAFNEMNKHDGQSIPGQEDSSPRRVERAKDVLIANKRDRRSRVSFSHSAILKRYFASIIDVRVGLPT